jgi:hypothetical protein
VHVNYIKTGCVDIIFSSHIIISESDFLLSLIAVLPFDSFQLASSTNRIGSALVSILALNAVYCGF